MNVPIPHGAIFHIYPPVLQNKFSIHSAAENKYNCDMSLLASTHCGNITLPFVAKINWNITKVNDG